MKNWMNNENNFYRHYLSEDGDDRMTNRQVLAASVLAIVCGLLVGVAATL